MLWGVPGLVAVSGTAEYVALFLCHASWHSLATQVTAYLAWAVILCVQNNLSVIASVFEVLYIMSCIKLQPQIISQQYLHIWASVVCKLLSSLLAVVYCKVTNFDLFLLLNSWDFSQYISQHFLYFIFPY